MVVNTTAEAFYDALVRSLLTFLVLYHCTRPDLLT
jgi:hypothetical protein